MSKEDKGLARRMVQDELRKTRAFLRQLDEGTTGMMVGYDDNGQLTSAPPPLEDGELVMAPVSIGERGSLSKQKARAAARVWREVTQRYPKAFFAISLLGYDEDPREIWEIPEAARYVRWWAKYAGMDDIAVADRWLGFQSEIAKLGLDNWGLGFLAACGVFGEETKRRVLAGFAPTSTN